MKTQQPTPQDFADLLAFLPKLTAVGYEPIRRWSGGVSADGKTVTTPWPEYDTTVDDFVRTASSDCWFDRGYDPGEAGDMLADPEIVRTADLAKIRAMITYCVRGERFCDGHLGAMIRSGKLQRLLQRLAEIRDTDV